MYTEPATLDRSDEGVSSDTPPKTFRALHNWEVSTVFGLFRPGRTITVQASSQFEAECLAQEQLAGDEWFPSFSAHMA